MITELRYENHLGVSINLNSGAYKLHENDLLDYDWAYEIISRPSGYGGVLKQASRQTAKYKAVIGVNGAVSALPAMMNAILAVTEPDVIAQLPGRLWRNGQYIRCYVMSGSITKHVPHYAIKQMVIIAVDPFWTTEATQTFYPPSGAIEHGKKYNLRYPYRYGTGYMSSILYNSHYTDTPMVITFFGEADDPSVTIAGHEYGMIATLVANERIVIDQMARTITKIGTTGVVTNLFNARDKTSDIFQPAHAGNSVVAFYSASAIEITLIQQRSEPLWI